MSKSLSLKLLTTIAVLGLAFASGAVAAERGLQTKTLTFCDGGASEAVITNTQNAPASTTSQVFVDMPSTGVPGGASGAAGDSDAYTVTFAGESSATGGGAWEAQAQISVNGGGFLSMNPIGPNTFHRGNPSQTRSMTWCNRAAATVSTSFKIVWRKVGGAAGGSAIIDDYTVQVERSN